LVDRPLTLSSERLIIVNPRLVAQLITVVATASDRLLERLAACLDGFE
jgi:hypothetical protein